MDNASYHSVRLSRHPSTSWRKQEIISWLSSHNVTVDECNVKVELLKITQNVAENKYVIDSTANEAGFVVERLPPYHSNLNPIELVWSDLKGYVPRNNKTFKLKDVCELVDTALTLVTPGVWQSNIGHVVKEEEKMWLMNGLSDNVVDSLIINSGGSSDDSISDMDSEPLSTSDDSD